MKRYTVGLAGVLVLGTALAGAQMASGGSSGAAAKRPQANSGSAAGQTGNAGSSAAGSSGPSAAETSDLGAQIQNAFQNEPTLANDKIQVDVNDSVIRLNGTVGSGKEKQTAERIAQSYAGNRRVVNRLSVSGSKARPDKGTTQEEPPLY